MTELEAQGITWWNEMNEDCRLFWLRAAMTSVPAEAWAYYRRVMTAVPLARLRALHEELRHEAIDAEREPTGDRYRAGRVDAFSLALVLLQNVIDEATGDD